MYIIFPQFLLINFPTISPKVPGFTFSLWNTSINWQYYAEKTNFASKALSEGSYWPRAKMLGGCSSINAMVYIRGNSRDYDNWEALGNPTWGWHDVLDSFKKAENMQIPGIRETSDKHGIGGPIKIDSYNITSFVHDLYENAAAELGYKTLQDLSDEFCGLQKMMGNFDNDVRGSTAHAYLLPARNRPNLHVIKHAQVIKIDFDEQGVATTVQFKLNDRILSVRQKKEIILSAGAIGSPFILMHSGVGPEKDLHQFNIPVVAANSAVGQNLQDHLCTTVFFRINKPILPDDSPNALQNMLSNYFHYLLHKSGPMTRPPIFDIHGFFNTLNETDKFPDVQIVAIHYQKGQHKEMRQFFDGMRYGQSLDMAVEANKETNVLLFSVVLLNPLSSGEIKLKSSNPFHVPIINANYLQHPNDTETLVRGVQFLRKFLQTKTFRTYDVQEIPITFPECTAAYGSDAFWHCYVRHITTTIFHPTGTAKMGPETDQMSVVDSELRVRKVQRLRVIDASIMPNIISGNTNAPSIMIGEKGADFVKQDWNNDS